MTVIVLITELYYLFGAMIFAPQRKCFFSRNEKRLLAWKLFRFRFQDLLSNRFKFRFDSAGFLGYKVQFLHGGLFCFNFKEVFVDEEYFFESDTDSPVIVDCGSNMGLATLYFKKLYPGAHILAVEAHPQTFGTLEKNIVGNELRKVDIRNLALTGSNACDAEIFFDREGDTRATRLRELFGESSPDVTSVTVSAGKLSKILPESVDLLKMDIEGSEIEVLQEIEAQLYKIKNIILEFHFIPGRSQMSLGEFLAFLEKNGFEYRLNTTTPAPVFSARGEIYTAMIHAYRFTSMK